MKRASQPVRLVLRAKPAPSNLSTCAQCAPIDSPISTFRTLFIMQYAAPISAFRINTCKSVSKQRTLTGSVDILVVVGVPQAVEVISQAEQQGLADLRTQAATRS